MHAVADEFEPEDCHSEVRNRRDGPQRGEGAEGLALGRGVGPGGAGDLLVLAGSVLGEGDEDEDDHGDEDAGESRGNEHPLPAQAVLRIMIDDLP